MLDIFSLGYAHEHNGQRFVAIPVSSTEPVAEHVVNRSVCPIASKRGAASSQPLLDALSDILSHTVDHKACPQCEGLWFYASDRKLHHISGDTLSRLDDLVTPSRNVGIRTALANVYKEPPADDMYR